MSTAKEQKTVTIPGKPLTIKVKGAQSITSRTPQTEFTALAEFESVKELLSEKPLRRPNRTRPID